ncbi:MAG: wax ester/triacylglycerol synthase family O-acyltransferase [Rudaea sp.]
MSAVDTAWLRMDRPHNLMMICGVLTFSGPLSIARLRRIVKARLLVFPRFRDRAVETATGAYWQRDAHFDIAAHVVTVRLPGRAGERELQALASGLVTTPLSRRRPMWQFHLVTNYRAGSAVIARFHHCYADGIALVRVMLSMMDASADGPPAMPFDARARRRTGPDEGFGAFLPPLAGVVEAARKVGGMLLEKGAALWNEPTQALALAEHGTAFTAELARIALMGEDSPTRFKGVPGVTKRVAWCDPLPLDEVKAVGHALGASVNDVMLTCVAGALREYLIAHGDPVDDVTFRALVPVNLRPIETAYTLGNEFGLVFLDLPLGIANPIARLEAVRGNMRALKGSYQPVIALGLLAAMGTGPRMLQEALLTSLARNASAVMTNVPGPQVPLWLGGARLSSLMFWVPQTGAIGLGVSIISYDGYVRFGIVADRGLCPDPERIGRLFSRAFETLVLVTLLSPWPREGDLDPALAEAVMTRLREGPAA